MSNRNFTNSTISGLSNLPETSPYLLNGHYVMISEQTSQNIFTSKRVNISSLYNDLNKYLTNAEEITFNSNFIFNSNLSIATDLIEKEIENNGGKEDGCYQLINLNYAYEKFIKPFNDLSSTIYEDIRMPSYVGQIIYTTTLRDESRVKKYYGEKTEWKKIGGRFILGVSSNPTSDLGSVNVCGGEVTHSLNIDEIPPHIHKFTPSSERKELVAQTTLGSDSSSAVVGTNSGKLVDNEDDHTWKEQMVFGCRTQQNRPDGVPKVSEVTIFGNKRDARCVIDDKISTSSRKTSHKNVPPFYTMYIWERIA